MSDNGNAYDNVDLSTREPKHQYTNSLRKLKRKAIRRIRKLRMKPQFPLLMRIAAFVVLGLLLLALILAIRSCSVRRPETKEQMPVVASDSTLSTKSVPVSYIAPVETKDPVEEEIDSYGNLGMVNLQDNGFLFIRQQPDEVSARIGKLANHAACRILEPETSASNWYDPEEWYFISSGGFRGYVKSEYLVTGEEAKELARLEIRDRVVVVADALSVREGPDTESGRLGTVYKNERCEILEPGKEWIRIREVRSDDASVEGYVKAEYVRIGKLLDEAKRLDDAIDKETALNMYTNLGMSNFENGHVNIRAGGSTDDKIIGMLLPGCAMQIIETTENGWYKIQSGPVTGYVKSDFVICGEDARSVALQKAQLMAISDTDGLNVRTKPSTEAGVLTSIASKERYPVVSQQDGWIGIDIGDTDENGNEVTAFVSSDYVTVRYALNEAFGYTEEELMLANSDSRRNSIVQYALQFVGNPYVWGGTSLTHGCDCSGFTQGVLAHFDIYIPRVSRDQANVGRRIKSDQLRPGDLIFYANSSGTINHVTMYIGGGRIVGAQSTKSGIKTAAWNYRTPVRIVNVMGD